MAPSLIQGTIATEDANFYQHLGVDPISLARVVWRAIRAREAVIGGSTIAQQLVKLVFLTPERPISRKGKKEILAGEHKRPNTRDPLLDISLNAIYTGSAAMGADQHAPHPAITKTPPRQRRGRGGPRLADAQ